MLKKMTLLGLLLLPCLLQAQVTINAQLPPGGLVQKDQLWYLVLVSTKTDVQDVQIKMSLQDAATGQIVMSANSGSLLLGKGVKIITSRDVQPITYNYQSTDFARNYLPMGAYIACYQLYHTGDKGDEPLGDECIRINIDPLSPPLLNTPAQQAELHTPYPQFTWMPPTPFDMFTDASYEILVTEVMPGQSATEAIQYNTPVYTKGNILQTYESYPSGFSALDTGKIYAWQVVARNGLNYAVKTEVWTFTVKQDRPVMPPVYGIYILLDNKVEGVYTVTKEDSLHIKFISSSLMYRSGISITDERGRLVKRFTQKINPGDNYFNLALGQGFRAGHIYKMTMADITKKQHSLRFSINKN